MATFRWPSGWDPVDSLRSLQREMDRMFGTSRGLGDIRRVGGGTYPPVNIMDAPDDIIVQCDVAGVRKEDLGLSITGETLIIKGVKKPPVDEAKVMYQRRERGSGEFSRTVVLGDPVDADKIEARLEAGVLTVRLPKSEASKPRQISVK